MSEEVDKEKLDCKEREEDTLKESPPSQEPIVEKVLYKKRPNLTDITLPVPIESNASDSKVILPVNDVRISKTEEEFLKQEKLSGGWCTLYAHLNQISNESIPSFSVSQLEKHEYFNRYTNILPNDSTRVILTGLDDFDYINANYVEVASADTKYIMTQGPLLETCEHFWLMVWQVGSRGIVMLNKLYEREVEKCYKYYPPYPGNSLEVGSVTVKCLSKVEREDYNVSNFQLKCGSESKPRNLTHFQYKVWPDFGAPASPHSFLAFLSVVRESGILHSPQTPAVIHCSAGVGRSGTFILIDSCLLIAERSNNCDDVNIQDTILKMRKQRFGCIQSKDQLRFSYACVIHGIKQCIKERGKVVSECSDKAKKRSLEDSISGDKQEIKKMRT